MKDFEWTDELLDHCLSRVQELDAQNGADRSSYLAMDGFKYGGDSGIIDGCIFSYSGTCPVFQPKNGRWNVAYDSGQREIGDFMQRVSNVNLITKIYLEERQYTREEIIHLAKTSLFRLV